MIAKMSWQSQTIVLAFALCVVGSPSMAQSQSGIYNDGSLNHSDPYIDRPYHPYSYDNSGHAYIPSRYEDGTLTDPSLRARIRLDLAMSPFVDREHIRISVDDGVATLSGIVADRRAMIDAVEIAYNAGARKVHNRLHPRHREARPRKDMRDTELKREIEEELVWSPFVNSDRIDVRVKNGVATLYGGVENTGEIADAVENAYEAGAKRVNSRLWVDPDL